MASKKLKITSAASTNLTQVQTIGGNLRGMYAINTNAAARCVKFYDSVDTPTVGTTVPVLTIQLPATGQFNFDPSDSISFKSSIWLAMTNEATDAGATAVGAGDIIATVFYE